MNNVDAALEGDIEKRFFSLFENLGIGVFQTSPDGKYVLANPMLASIYGFDSAEELKSSILNISEQLYISPHRRTEFTQLLEERDVVIKFESQIRRKDGSVIWISENARAIRDQDGNVIFYEGTVEDITENKSALETIHAQASLLNKAQDAIIVENLDGSIVYWNRSAENLYGWSAEEAKRCSNSAFLYVNPEIFTQARNDILQHGEWTGRFTQITKSGKQLVIQSRWTLICDANGQAESILSINSDITEKRSLEDQILRTQRMESLGILASGIAHDLNNVFSPILMISTLLQNKVSEPKAKSMLETLDRSARRGAELVKQVLTFTKGITGDRCLVQVNHLLADMQNIITETFPKNISLESNLAKDLRPITADSTQIHQVLLNLCLNARDAMPHGGTLSLSSRNIEVKPEDLTNNSNDLMKSGPHILITIQDTGTGISSDIAEKIYDPFFTTKEAGKGTGLGLTMVSKIVMDHSGFISLDSTIGKGTSFHVFLPALQSDREPAARNQTQLTQGNGELILLIDDELSICEITKTTLESFNYKVIVAYNGPEGVAQFAKHCDSISLVLMDLAMPLMDGPSTIKALRHIKPEAPIVVITGILGDEVDKSTEDLHVKGIIMKPFTLETLVSSVNEVLLGKETNS